MVSVVKEFYKTQKFQCPSFASETIYEVISGSHAYGINTKESDLDIVGICIPPKNYVFPHLRGEIEGFGTKLPRFNQVSNSKSQVKPLDNKNREVDFTVYGIVRFFQLVMENNPNMIDTLFVGENCILQITSIGNIIKDHKREFLHRGSWFKFRGYAYAQMKRAKSITRTGQRQEVVEEYGYDVKHAMHIVRLLNEIEQILIEGDLDLTRDSEQLKSIRRGEWTLKQIEDYFYSKEKDLESIYSNSKLRDRPDEQKIKSILLHTLEEYYGNLDNCIRKDERGYYQSLLDIKKIIDSSGI